MTTTHDRLSPSKAHRWLACPGSVREEARYPDEPGGPAAIDGTHSHTLLEHCIKGGMVSPLSMTGIKMKDRDREFVVDRARAERVQVAIDYVKLRPPGTSMALAEQRVNPAHYLGRNDMAGTADIQVTAADEFEVIDYKDGMNEVEAKDNPQLELYALGALARLKMPINATYPFTVIRITIIQPKLALRGINPIKSHVMTVPELMGKIGKFVAGAAATDQPDAPLVSGSHCKYCKHKACAVRADDRLKEIGIMFPIVNQPAAPVDQVQEIAQQAADMNPTAMTDEKIAQIMLAAPLVRQMIEAVEEESLRRLKAGHPIPGLKVVNGRGSRSWALPEEEMATKLIGMGIPKGVVYETKLVTPAKVENLKWEKTKAGAKIQTQLSERQLKTLDVEYIAKVAGKLTVVPESDPRPAVVLDASPLFQAVPQLPAAETLPAWLS